MNVSNNNLELLLDPIIETIRSISTKNNCPVKLTKKTVEQDQYRTFKFQIYVFGIS